MEEKAISSFTGNNENTMNAVLSSSVGMVLLQLAQKYLGDVTNEEINSMCQDALKEIKLEISVIAKYADRGQGSLENLIQEFESAIDFIEKKIKERCDLLDTVTLYLKGKIQIPLKEVFLLVWRALNDDREYVHHYQGSEEEKLEQSTRNKTDRQCSFLRCLIQLHRNPVCHQGIRHELVFLLNKVYSNVNIIEDGTLTTLSYLKENIFNRFVETYKSADSEKRKCLMSSLICWMENCDTNPLLEQIDIRYKDELRSEITELFAHHGSGPELITPFIDQALSYLEFSCDPQAYPLYAKINYLLNEVSDQCELRSKALNCMKGLIYQIQPEDIQAAPTIIYFQPIYQVHKEITRSETLIRMSGIDVSQFIVMCEEYFTAFIANEKFPKVLTCLLEQILSINQLLEEVKKDKLVSPIENFFVHWYMAINDRDKVRQKVLYKFLLDDSIKTKIILNDTEIENWLTSKSAAGVKEITPYEINRIFLHAIMIKPQDWSNIFYQLYAEVLAFANNNFDQNTEIAASFKHDSYPEELIVQLNYLQKCYQALAQDEEIHEIECPQIHMILLPENIQTTKQWISFSDILKNDDNGTLLDQIYFRHRVRINNILCRLENNNLSDIKKSIPKKYRMDFLLSQELCDSIKNDSQLDRLLDMISLERRYKIIQNMGQKCYGIITRGSVLIRVLKTIPVENRNTFLQGMGEKCYEIVEDGFQLARILDKVPLEYCYIFLQGMSKRCYEVIEDKYQLKYVLNKIPAEFHYFFLQGMGERCHEIIKNDQEFSRLIFKILPEQQDELKNERNKYQANQCSHSDLHSDLDLESNTKTWSTFPTPSRDSGMIRQQVKPPIRSTMMNYHARHIPSRPSQTIFFAGGENYSAYSHRDINNPEREKNIRPSNT
jgi:hypothetical protein